MKRIILGIALLAGSFFWDFYPSHNFLVLIFYGMFFCFGLLFLSEGMLSFGKDETTPLVSLTKIKHILIVCVLASITIEGFGNLLFKAWVYPYATTIEYLLLIPVLLCFYFFVLFEGYIGVLSLFKRFFPREQNTFTEKPYYKYFYPFLGFIGIAGFIGATYIKFLGYHTPSHVSDIFNVYWQSPNTMISFLLVFFSLWFVFEYLEYLKKEDSFLMHLLAGDMRPFLAIVVTSGVTSVLMEVFNMPLKIWVYTNVPNANILFLGIPIAVFIFWPFQYLLFDSMYHFLFKKETKNIW